MPRPHFRCSVQTQYMAEQSKPQSERYAFSYTVTVHNEGDATAQLVARHWIITNGNGRTEEVRGLAVVGHQPVLKPGQQFQYTSSVLLDTPHGQMRGTYFCMTEDARPFDAEVPEFQLVFPGLLQ